MLEARRLVKRYYGHAVVDRVSFVVQRGEVVGYLGPNGSGKTTTTRMLTGLLEPTSGAVLFDGRDCSHDPIEFRRRLGYVPEEPHLYPFLSGREYLELVGRLRELPAASIDRKTDPDLLIFDEPDSGLDVTSALVLRHLVANLAARGKAILYTSHILDVVERICTRVIVLHEGRLVADDSVDQLRTRLASASLEEVFAQLVLRRDPERTARDIADVVTVRA